MVDTKGLDAITEGARFSLDPADDIASDNIEQREGALSAMNDTPNTRDSLVGPKGDALSADEMMAENAGSYADGTPRFSLVTDPKEVERLERA